MKSILVFSSMLFVSLAAFFQGSVISVNAEMPNYIKPSDGFELVVNITKAELSGFSKFQMIFPDGFTVENLDSKGGTFSYVDQKLKIIWVSLPSEASFPVKFKVTSSPDSEGTFDFEGKFSYIQDGARKDTDFMKKLVVSNTKPENIDELTASKEPSTQSINSAASTTAVAAKPVGSFTFFRSLSESEIKEGESLVVTLDIGKGNVSGFGKITEVIPAGYTAEVVEANGAVFSAVAGEVRFMWMTLPAENNFKVSYKLISNDKVGGQLIKGSFSYVENEKTRINSTSASSFVVKEDEVLAAAETNPVEKDVVTPEPESVPVKTETPKEEPKKEIAEVKPVEKAKPEVVEKTSVETAVVDKPADENTATETTVPTNTSGSGVVAYRVQICATKKNVDTQYFVKNHSVSETIYADMHEGWHKYTVGKFSVYQQARNHREDVRTNNKIVGPFVTAYNAGQRITVQEALMISKQQWVP